MKALKTTPCSLAPTVPKSISDSSKKQVIAISCECLSLKWLHGTCNIFSCCVSNSRRSLTCCSALAAVLRPDWTESFSPNQGWKKVSNFPFIWMASLGIYILEMGWKWITQDSFRRFLIAEAVWFWYPLWGRKLHPLKVNKKRFCFWYPILQGEISRSDLTVGSLKVQKGKSGKINTNKNGKTQEKLAFKKHFQHSRLCTVDTACAHACKIWVKETETTTCRNPSIFHRHVINWTKKTATKDTKTNFNQHVPTQKKQKNEPFKPLQYFENLHPYFFKTPKDLFHFHFFSFKC